MVSAKRGRASGSHEPLADNAAEVSLDDARVTEPVVAWVVATVVVLLVAFAIALRIAARQPHNSAVYAVACGMVVSVLCACFVAVRRSEPVLVPMGIRASRVGVHLRGARFLPNARIRALSVAATPGGIVVTLRTVWRAKKLWFATRADAEAVRAALGRAMVRAELSRETSVLPYVALAVGFATVASWAGYTSLTPFMAPFAVIFLPLVRRRWSRLPVRYRVAAVPRERILELMEDTAADLSLRVAAADALVDDEDAATQARIQYVMETTASTELQAVVARRR